MAIEVNGSSGWQMVQDEAAGGDLGSLEVKKGD